MADNETFIDLFPDADPEATARPDASADSLDPALMLTRLPRWQDDALEVRATLGQGGMGIVRLAHQPALGRDVAVKTLKREHRNEEARWRVLQEAWAAGFLEHPNIVPVYGLGLDDEDMPYIVLKKLEGDRWSDRLSDPGIVIDEHLRILEGVAQAVTYAHDRDIVHRDLKPDNVMIGAYDEITLIDWGLAVTTGTDGERRLPRASDQRRPAGTPSYMAPEQLAEHGARPGKGTDIFQLGGLLYTVLHGEPPHGKGRLDRVIDRVREGLPPLGDHLDPEARALLGRAMARDPADRHPDAHAFLHDLRAYRTHRAARALLDEAHRQAEGLEALLEVEGADARGFQQALGALRFGVHEARRIWPEAPTDRFDATLATFIRHHLDRDEAGAARMLLDELITPRPELADEVAQAEAARTARDAEREALLVDQSPSTGIRTRAFVLSLIGIAWIVVPIAGRGFAASFRNFQIATAALLLVTLALAVWARDSLGRSMVNRFVIRQLLAVPILQLFVLTVTERSGGSVDEALQTLLGMWAAMAGANIALLGWIFAPMALAYGTAYTVAMVRPDLAMPALVAANAVLLANVLIPWGPQLVEALKEDKPPGGWGA